MSYILTLEPAAAAWRGPQRLVLKIEAERVEEVEYRLDLPIRPATASKLPLVQAVARICSSCTHAHSLAFALAFESLLDLEIPLRPSRLRLVATELERTTSHLTTLEAIFNLMGMNATAIAIAAVRATIVQGMGILVGETTVGPLIVPGGLSRDVSEEERVDLHTLLASASDQLYMIADKVIDQRFILARTGAIGTLSHSAAAQFQLRGPLARASGQKRDERLDAPYGAYVALAPQLITQESGDVYARLVVLLLESLESLKLSDRALDNLPEGPAAAPVPPEVAAGVGEATVEAPRGSLRYRIESDGTEVRSYRVEPAPQLDRLLARTLLVQAAPDDVVLIALSTDPCSACQRARDEY